MSKRSPKTRSYLSAWLDTSITIWRLPESTVLRRWRHRSGDSGVVLWLSWLTTPSSVWMEPRIDGSIPAASSMERSM